METDTLKVLQKQIFVDIDNIALFVNLSKLQNAETDGSGTSSSSSRKVRTLLQKGVYSLLGKAQVNIGSEEFELDQERQADGVIASSSFKTTVGPALNNEPWAELFSEAIQARTVGVVTRSLNEAGFDDLLNKPHVLAWVIHKLITGKSDILSNSKNTVKIDDLKDLQSRVYRRYALMIKKNVDALNDDKWVEQNSASVSIRGMLATKLRRNLGKAYLDSSRYKERTNILLEILADPQMKQEICGRLGSISPELFEQEMEAEVVRVITEVIPTPSGKNQFSDNDIELFAQITEMIVNDRIDPICQDHNVKSTDSAADDYRSHDLKTDAVSILADDYYSNGFAFTEEDNWDLAIKEFDKAIELNPYEALYYNDRGGCRYSLDHLDDAISDYSKAIEIDPTYPYAYFNRGMAYSDLERYELAINDFDSYLADNSMKSDSDYLNAYMHRGWAHFKLNRFEEAIRDYAKVVATEPTNEMAYFRRGVAFSRLGDFSEAVKDFAKAIELGCEDPVIFDEKRLAQQQLVGNELT